MIAASVLGDNPFGQIIERVLFSTRLWKYREIIDSVAKINISEEARQFLTKYFEDDILTLEDLLSLNLNEWKNLKRANR
jgi:hypothetical protein